MFGRIAPRYDLLNHLLSLSVDRYWRYRTRKQMAPLLPSSARVLDVCTGTGDLAIEMSRLGQVIGCDFTHEMLVLGTGKVRQRNLDGQIRFVEGDALQLPFPPSSFDAVTIAFGLRNLADYQGGIREMTRVLRPGGILAVLEFSTPPWPVFRQAYLFYFKEILPRIGRLVSGEEGPYSYLPQSVGQFPEPPELRQMIQSAGFAEVDYRRLSGGIAALHWGRRNVHRSEAEVAK